MADRALELEPRNVKALSRRAEVQRSLELREEAEVLWALGVPLTQGYYFGRPQRELRWAPPPA